MQLGGTNFSERHGVAVRRIEACIDAILAAGTQEGEIARPHRLLAAMRHAALNGGKRLRPFLALEAARLFSADAGEGMLRAACAIELVHCYSLVHDDLPAMDDDDTRRGLPTVHVAFDEATAILAGDGLLTLAFDVMAGDAVHPDGAVRAALVAGLARAAGLGGMAGGQMLDLQAEKAGHRMDESAIAQMQAMKTGALLRFAVEAGAIHAGAGAPERAALAAYGNALGAAFQIADDILDAEGDPAKLGKATAKDAGRNKATLVAALGLDGARAACSRLADEAVAALAIFGPKAKTLEDIVRFTIARDH